jgi:redox-sensitive bicupin YhaK (pirin superfamily)
MCSARSAVEAVGDSIKFVLAVDRQIGALGQVLTPQDVPVIQRPGVRVRVPLGSIDGVRSPLTPPAEVTLLDITLEARAELALPVAAGERAFFMPIFGSAEFNGEGFGLDDLGAPILPAATDATTHKLVAIAGGAKVAVFIGEPLRQPVLSNGPMAFASEESLMAATSAYRRGEMGRL